MSRLPLLTGIELIKFLQKIVFRKIRQVKTIHDLLRHF